MANHYVITFSCRPDRPGIVHALSGTIVDLAGNITESQQYSSPDTGRFFMRIQVEVEVSAEELIGRLTAVAERFAGKVRVDEVARPVRTLILASKASHAVEALLSRTRTGSLPITVPLIMANHPDLAGLAGFYGVGFEHHEVTASSKAGFEQRIRQVVADHDIELVVLARYMQILSPELCQSLASRIINIHHSFLPGFKGANPYRQAHARGVKLIGATAHFVTADLDEGPIIEQAVTRVDHAKSVADLREIGQNIESQVLAQAVKMYAQHRVLLDGVRTVVFS